MKRIHWKGKAYEETGLLLLGESTYSWLEDGEYRDPEPDHAKQAVEEVIENFEEPGRPDLKFMKSLTRALAGEENPTRDRREFVWKRVSFQNYVPEPVGNGARTRPSKEQWELAANEFPRLMEDLDPSHVIVLGWEVWNKLPAIGDTKVTENVFSFPRGRGHRMFQAFYHPSSSRWTGWRPLADVLHFTFGQKLLPPGTAARS